MDKRGLLVQKKEIMENFDFDRVHEVMKLLNWEWGVIGCATDAVPNRERICTSASDRIDNVIKSFMEDPWHESTYVSSGGFKARIVTSRSGIHSLELSFEIVDFKGLDNLDLYTMEAIYGD